MYWFTSDLHLNHISAISMCNRPFENVEEMNNTLIANINSVVAKTDTLYLLGDISHRGKREQVNELLERINCKNKILVLGNHDKKYDESLFCEIHKLEEIHVLHGGKNYSITLCHYPMMSWPKSNYGSIHLHGHIHSKPDEYNLQMKKEGIRRYDVGVDANRFMPVSLEDILKFMGI